MPPQQAVKFQKASAHERNFIHHKASKYEQVFAKNLTSFNLAKAVKHQKVQYRSKTKSYKGVAPQKTLRPRKLPLAPKKALKPRSKTECPSNNGKKILTHPRSMATTMQVKFITQVSYKSYVFRRMQRLY